MVAILAGAAVCAAATATPEGCRALRLHGKKAEATACFEALTRSGDAYRMAEGFWGLAETSDEPWEQRKQFWEQSKNEFEIAIGQPNALAAWKVRYGRLFLKRFNSKDALGLFTDALKQEPGNAEAYLAMAIE